MKRTPLALVALLLLIIGTAIPAHGAAANAPGTKCTKAGASAKSGSVMVKCVKSGSKLLWQKVVVATKVAPTPSNSTAPSTSETSQDATSTSSQNSPKPNVPKGPPMPGNPCATNGETQPLGAGSITCINFKWEPVNPAGSGTAPVGNAPSGSASSNFGLTNTAEITPWAYLSVIGSGSQGLGNVSDASLVQEPSGKIRVYFKNGNDSEANLKGFDNFIHSATSTDGGKTWTIESGVRIAVQSPVEVLPKTGGGYQAWGWGHKPGNDYLYYAESADGLTFTEIAIPGLDVTKCKTSSGQAMGPMGDPAIVKLSDGTWLMHLQGFGVGNTGPEFARWACVATSPDGKTWTPVQSRSYGGSPDVQTNPNIYMNKSGKIEWMWPSPLGVITKVGDGNDYGDANTYIQAGDPERLDLADGTELYAMGGFDNRAGGVITFAKKVNNSYSIATVMGGPSTGGSPNRKMTWTVSGASESQITVQNFCLNKNVKNISGATVTMTTTGGVVTVVATDPANDHACVGVLVGPERIIG